MHIKILTIGHKSNKYESDEIAYYEKQLPKNLKVNFVNIKSEQNQKLKKNEILSKESKSLQASNTFNAPVTFVST